MKIDEDFYAIFAYMPSIFQLNPYTAVGLHLMYHPRAIMTKEWILKSRSPDSCHEERQS